MPKDKLGNKLSWKEYLQRWKRGIEGITPLQQTNIQIKGIYIIILGLLSGITISIIGFKNLWWLMLILIGGLFNTVMQWVGLYQKKKTLERIYTINEGEERIGRSSTAEDIIEYIKEVQNE